MKRTVLLWAALVLAGSPAWAQQQLTTDPKLAVTRVGTRGAAFLHLGVGARAQSLGGAFSAVADDISALYWNSAGIGQLEGFTAGLSQASLYDGLDIAHTFVGAVLPVGDTRFGVSVNALSSGRMDWLEEDYPANGYGGHFNPERADFEWNSLSIGAHVAQPITDRLFVGGALKFISEGIQGADVSYIAGDVGTLFRTGIYGVTLGATLQNLGAGSSMQGLELRQRINTSTSNTQLRDLTRQLEVTDRTFETDLPTLFRFSVVTDLIGPAAAVIRPDPAHNLMVVADIRNATDTDMQPALGLEYGFRNQGFLRAGKRWSNETQIDRGLNHGLSAGAGVRLPVGGTRTLLLDYAYTAMEDLSNVQVLSVQFRF